MTMPDIGIESCSVGDSNYAPFMNTKQYVQVVFRNRSSEAVTISRVMCSFPTEPGVDAKVYAIDTPLDIEPGGRSEVAVIPFTVDLGILPSTHYTRIKIEYTTSDGRKRSAEFAQPRTAYIVPLPINPFPESQLFISHKIPLDTQLARRLAHYLSKIRIRGYVAEDDPRYGHHMHTGKFTPEIDNSKAVVILWTAGAAADPGTMSWEMDYARERRKRLIVVKEDAVDAPRDVPADLEYFDASTPISEASLIYFVTKLYNAYRRGLD